MNHGDEVGPRRGISRGSSSGRAGASPAGVWAVAAGRDGVRAAYGLAHEVAVVGWSRTGDLTTAQARHDVAGLIRAAYPDIPAPAISFLAADLWAFAHDLAAGDIVATALPGGDEIAFGRVGGPYRFDADAPENRQHQRSVEWLRRRARSACDAELLAGIDATRAIRRIRDVAPQEPVDDRRVSRRAFVRFGAATGAAAAVAAVWRPWRSSSDPTATPTADLLKGKPQTGSSPNGRTARWVQVENAKRGTTAWNVTNGGAPGQIEGYCSQVSAVHGDTVALSVSTVAPTFHVEAYRLGWYSGAGGRLVWSSPEQPGQNQGPGTFTPGINMTEANWTPSVHVPITTAFPPGCYLFKLVGSSGIQQVVPLTVRDDSSKATYVVQNSVTSWQAYNDWHGYNLYQGQNGAFATRSRIVSFDRPYARGDGQSDFLGLEFPLVMLMEQLGLDVTYITDIDTHLRPDLLLNHKAYFSLGHDEYWSVQMRDGVEAARDHGVNLAFLGANAAYRQIRLEASSLGPNRHQVCYKSATEDPIHATNPSLTTVNWRSPPVNRPESEMIGEQYECNPVQTDMVIVDPSAWVFAGANVQAGQHLVQAVGSEYDRYDPNQAGPKNVQILCHSPLTCQKRPSFADMTYYSAPSGAGVFASGSI
ncbi:MAG TPA: N,N-dimethylformamidase beta subunit family domain-containing protein, partial [Acidimicrobiia bacterium]|nr:N,N-dimethylformamidase beta subunit family domain-containing protein [Acidimicrobiia bacterium]